jgi:tetratricopeptide (TPR) repeat protein
MSEEWRRKDPLSDEGCAPPGGAAAADPGALLREAVAAHQAGRHGEAEALYRRLLEAVPDHADANHLMGMLACQTGRPEAAPALIASAVAKAPAVAAYRLTLATALQALARLDEAEAAYRAALALEPALAEAHAGLGTLHARRFHNEEAEAAYRKALAIDPTLIEAHVNLGNVLAEEGRHAEAADCFRAALALQPSLAQAHYNLGNALKATGDLEGAAACYREVIALDPAFVAAHMNLGNALRDLGRPDDAAESYRAALRLNPDHATANANLGEILKAGNRIDEAVACYREALRIDPQYAWVHYELGQALRAKGRTEEARACYRTALDLDPDFAAAPASLADILKSEGRLEEAASGYREALDIDPEYADARTNLGLALQALGRADEAIAEFERLGGHIAEARVLECLFAAGRKAEFRDRLTRLSGRDPANLRIAAISAFSAQQWGTGDPYPFCPGPLDFISIESIAPRLAPFDRFAGDILEEIRAAPVVWQPRGNATKGGFHTTGNLFELASPRIAALGEAIAAAALAYRARYAGRGNVFLTRWPERPTLYGWHVRLLASGFMEPHIHTSGWLSGVLYLKMPERGDPDEGSITFSLHGYDYPVLDPDIPAVHHRPAEGDLVLFPSSLFHHTSRFSAEDERHCIAFDLCPRQPA